MYQIHEDVSVELNKITPFSVKKYQAFLKTEGEKSQVSIEEGIKEKIKENVTNGEVTEKSLISLVNNVIQANAIDALQVYTDKDFVDEWTDVLFKDVDKEKVFIDWEIKFSWDEFMRGFFDFFARLRQPLKR